MNGQARMTLIAAAISPNESEASLTSEQLGEVLDLLVQSRRFAGQRVLLIVPDNTRTAPIGPIFRGLHGRLRAQVQCLDVMIALGTHPPLDAHGIRQRLAISAAEQTSTFADVQVYNHAFNDPRELTELGVISEAEIRELSQGRFGLSVPVRVNRRLLDYDLLLVIGPVFPHEVVGFSGGNKYFFPGVGGPEILNFFHWLGAVLTSPFIIGNAFTPVRRIVDRAAAMIPRERLCLAAVVDGPRFAGLYAGTPEAAWEAASQQSARLHITLKSQPFTTVVSCAPAMYEELWLAGKCMYKLEPVVADGGELIIYAPHLREISQVHGPLIREIGYHCRDYFLQQWPRFQNYPWGVLAHSTHVNGIGAYENGIETRRVHVTLASQIPESLCRAINLGYRDPASIHETDYVNREAEGVLWVPRAGERLFHLRDRPSWAGGSVRSDRQGR